MPLVSGRLSSSTVPAGPSALIPEECPIMNNVLAFAQVVAGALQVATAVITLVTAAATRRRPGQTSRTRRR
jgi:hypothetical protein